MRLTCCFLLLLLVALPADCQSWSIFVNNKPFKGVTTGGPDKLMLDATVLASTTDIGLKVEGGQVSLKGESLPSVPQGDTVLVDGRDLARRVGGKYTVNKDLNSVDIYLLATAGSSSPAPATSAGAAIRVTCVELVEHPDKYEGKRVVTTGELVNYSNVTDEQIANGWPACLVRGVVDRHVSIGYYNVWVVTQSRVKHKDGTALTVEGIFLKKDTGPTIRASRIAP